MYAPTVSTEWIIIIVRSNRNGEPAVFNFASPENGALTYAAGALQLQHCLGRDVFHVYVHKAIASLGVGNAADDEISCKARKGTVAGAEMPIHVKFQKC